MIDRHIKTICFALLIILAGISHGVRTPCPYTIDNYVNSESFWRGSGFRSISDTTSINIGCIRSIRVDIQAMDSVVFPEDTARFRIIIENSGNVVLNDIRIWEAMDPPLVGYVSMDMRIDTFEIETVDTFFTSGLVGYDVPFNTYIFDTVWVSFDDPLSGLFRNIDNDPFGVNAIEVVSDYDSIFVGFRDTLTIEKYAETDTVLTGNTMVYTIEISNRGNRDIGGVMGIDSLPLCFELTNWDEGHYLEVDTVLSSDRVLYWLGELPMNGVDSMRIMGRFDSTCCNSSVLNRALLKYEELTFGAEDSVSIICHPTADLTLEQVDSNCTLGDTIRYLMRVKSTSLDTIENLVLENYLPNHTNYVSGGGIYDAVTRKVIWNLDPLPPGQTEDFVVTLMIRHDVPLGSYELSDCAKLLWMFRDERYLIDEECVSCDLSIPFLHIEKQCFQRECEVGDILLYHIEVFNHSSASSLPRVLVYDEMPTGFDIVPGSIYIDNQPGRVHRKVGKTIIFSIDNLDVVSSVHLIYQVVVSQSALEGDGVNRAYAVGSTGGDHSERSDEAACRVRVKKAAFTEGEMVIGKVYYDHDGSGFQNIDEPGAEGVVLYTEDGMKIHTDPYGRFSIPQIMPGKHVIRIDHTTLPDNTQPAVTTTRNLLDPYSQLIDVPQSGIARATFALRRSGLWIEKRAFSPAQFEATLDVDTSTILFETNYSHVDTVIESIFFNSGSDLILGQERDKLDRFIDMASHFYGVEVRLAGHADKDTIRANTTKDIENNFQMAQLRLDQVRNMLIEKGFDPRNISQENYGSLYARAKTRKQKAGERRVDIIAFLTNTGRPATPVPVLNVTTSIDIKADEHLSQLELKYDLYGLMYIPGTVSFGGVPIGDPNSLLRPGWLIENPLNGQGLTFSVLPDSAGYYRITPLITANVGAVFESGIGEYFELKRIIMPEYDGGSARLSFPADIGLTHYRAILPFKYSQIMPVGTELLTGQVVTFQIRAFVPGKTGEVEVRDEIPDGFKYINHSAEMNGEEIKPMLSKGKLVWKLQLDGGGIAAMEYKCEVTRPMTMPDLSNTAGSK